MGSERTTGRRVLVVEDDPGTRDLLVELLSGEGYEVRAAADGLEGIAAANGFRPDVIVLDLGLPRMDGRDFLVAYRAAAGPAAVVIVTGAIDAEAPLADVVLEKPFRIDHLRGEIAARPRGTSPRGLDHGERGIYLLGDRPLIEVVDALDAGGVDVPQHAADGSLQILRAQRLCTRSGSFDARRLGPAALRGIERAHAGVLRIEGSPPLG